ncbi:TetR family transcriptional regulator [Pseudonocardiaceae bacterium YIM PH 21723]|nr:TetR family transcriptional regulator [Pseudonocardiaceae bacterium YIM PH 21723]
MCIFCTPCNVSERQERRKVARRAEIRRIAVRLALDNGLEAATTEAISAAADISRRTFFNYFGSKDEVFSLEPHQWTAEEIVAELRERPVREKPVESMRVVVQSMAAATDFAGFAAEWELLQQLYRRHPELYSRMKLDQADRAIAALVAEFGVRLGVDPAADLYPGMLVNAGFAALQAAENHSRTGDRDLASLIDEAFALLARGL